MTAELKQVFAEITKKLTEQGDTLKKMNEEIKLIKHACTDNSSRSTSSEK